VPKHPDDAAPAVGAVSVQLRADLPSVVDSAAVHAAYLELVAALEAAGAVGSVILTGSTDAAEAFTYTAPVPAPPPADLEAP